MKHIVSDFTRGSQIHIHGLLMYFVGLKYPAIFAVFVFIWLAWSEVSGSLSEHQQYLIWMKLYAGVWGFMEFDPAKHVTIQSGLGEGRFPMSRSLGPKRAVWVEAEIERWVREVAEMIS